MLDLGGHGRVALITGGAGGIGRVVAETFAAAGYGVLIVDLDPATGAAAATALAQYRPGAAFVAADVAVPEQAAHAVEAAFAHFDRLDLVFNGAGISGRGAPIEELDLDNLDRVIAVNLKGSFHVCQHAVAALRRSGGGVILNVASITADAGSADYAPYAASKAGVIALTRSLARRVGRYNIRVNCIRPGSIEGTGLMRQEWAGHDPETRQRQNLAKLHHIPLGRAGQPQDVAWLALFLASPHARHIHGATLTIDGGESLGYQ